MTRKSFVREWTVANTLGMFVAYLPYTLVAHGVTGGHDRNLSVAQLVAHSIALFAVAQVLFHFQAKVLSDSLDISSARRIVAGFGFLALFWLGYYQPWIADGPDYDILFGFFALGIGLWIGRIPVRGKLAWHLVALLAFPVASFIGELLLILVVVVGLGLRPNMQENLLVEAVFWLVVGTSTGLLGGWAGGHALSRLLELGSSAAAR